MGGPEVAALGFGMGVERLMLLLKNQNTPLPEDSKCDLYIAPMGENESKKAFELATELRLKGIVCELDHMGRGIKAQFKYADKISAKYVGVIGSNELNNGIIKIKEMASGEEQEVTFSNVYEFLSK